MRWLSTGSLCLLLACCFFQADAQGEATLARVRARGVLWCGIDRSEAEYSSTDEHGSRRSFDLDLCKAVAVAALGPGAPVKATFYADDVTGMEALAAGTADVVASLSADAVHRAWHRGDVRLGFSEPVLYDTVGLLVPRESGVRRAAELSGKKVCFLTETHTEERLHAWFRERGLDLLPFPFQEEGEMEAAFVTGNCAALAGDLTRLAETRADTGTRSKQYILLPESLGEDTLALAYRGEDPAWKQLVDWTRNVLLNGAGRAIGSSAKPKAKVHDAMDKPGTEPAMAAVSSPAVRAADVLAAVGSYSVLFTRDLGIDSELKLPPETSVAKQ